MIFKLRTSESFYPQDVIRDYESLGFRFTLTDPIWREDNTTYYKDSKFEPVVEINTLEDLMEFQKEWGMLVITEDTIEIYDGYRE